MLPFTHSFIHSRIFIKDLSQALFNVLELRNTVGWEEVREEKRREREREIPPAFMKVT